ncbi:PREDICTED: uncharacterized protein LOC101629416 isoform X1 [Condylura cristata]|uniref:uncharacterized protein LOC101629416 isoform X1 n=1 Tax=Condylura cristata TaxID=143302 RepID=UPI000643CFAD|nr:PREDICTED: uncharacterized protein LOC101629416 isoform X1 [Condylura cristata]
MDSARLSDLAAVTLQVGGAARGCGLPFVVPQHPAYGGGPTQAGGGGTAPQSAARKSWRLQTTRRESRAGRSLGPGGCRRRGAPVSTATARSSGRLLDRAAATADWTLRGAESANCLRPRGFSSWTAWRCPAAWMPKAVAQTAAPPAGSRGPPGPRTVAGPVQKPVTSLCQAQPTAWMRAAPSLRKLAGPLAALAAALSATVPVRANFLTARASTVSALRSSSDEESLLPFGEWPASGAHMPSSLRGLRTPFSRQLEPQMAGPAHQPGKQQWRTWLPAE